MRIGVTIVVLLFGICLANAQTSCSTVLCRWGRCVVNNNKATCVCPDACPLNFDPVCGSDGKTYGNACALGIEACRTQGGVYQVSTGECPETGPTSCAAVSCLVGQTCRVVNGIARCTTSSPTPTCATVCTKELSPRCGSDGVTYGNKCLMDKKTCETQGAVYEVFAGRCENNPCNTVRCGWGATCRVQNGRGVCDCNRACAEIWRPVCGTDGTTYGNACELDAVTCTTSGAVTKAHDGECEQRLTCASVLCAQGNACEMVDGRPQCIPISRSCQVVRCNSTTHCEIVNGRAKCVPNDNLNERQVGEWCGGRGIVSPQCATGLICTPDPTSPVGAGICEEDCALVDCRSGRICKIQDHRAQCVCPTVCTREYDPRCGSDGRTYGNGCEMNVATCNSDGRIYEVSRGECRRTEQACTVNQWKNNQPQWSLAKATPYYNIFGYSISGKTTFKEVILSTGTSNYEKLVRESVAAYLNAAKGLTYRYTREEVVSKTREALRTNSYSSVLNQFSEANNVGNCPFA